MSASVGGSAEPDLTPMLDMVFQLITFFMLVLNLKTAELDTTLMLPVVGSARPVEGMKEDELMVLNINKEGHLKAYGRDVGHTEEEISNFLLKEGQASLLSAKKNYPNIQAGDELPALVVVRADKATPFKLLNIVLTKCQENGFRNFALKSKSLQ
jgi:biopolymer transport protein ExbD